MLAGGYLAGRYGAEEVILGTGLLAFGSLMALWFVFSPERLVIAEQAW